MSLQTAIRTGIYSIGTHITHIFNYTVAQTSIFAFWCLNTPVIYNIILSLGLVALLSLAMYIRKYIQPENDKSEITADDKIQELTQETAELKEQLSTLTINKNDIFSELNFNIEMQNNFAAVLSNIHLKALWGIFLSKHDDEELTQLTFATYPILTSDFLRNYYAKLTLSENNSFSETEGEQPCGLEYKGTEADLKINDTSVFIPKKREVLDTFLDTIYEYYLHRSDFKLAIRSLTDEKMLFLITEIGKFTLENSMALVHNSKIKQPFATASALIEKHHQTLLSNCSVNLTSTYGQLERLMQYLEIFNTTVEQSAADSEDIFDLEAKIDQETESLYKLARRIAKLLPVCFLECLPGTKEFSNKKALWRLNYDTILPKEESSLLPYVAESARNFPLRSKDLLVHPLVEILKNPDQIFSPRPESPQVKQGMGRLPAQYGTPSPDHPLNREKARFELTTQQH